MPGQFLAQRRDHINRKGRMVEFQSRMGAEGSQTLTKVPVKGYSWNFRPDQIKDQIQQGDSMLETLNDEFAASGFAPRFYDSVIIDGLKRTVKGRNPVYDGEQLIGWSIWVKG
jgi:hypothetical protein